MEIAVRHINELGGIKALGNLPLELVVEDSGGLGSNRAGKSNPDRGRPGGQRDRDGPKIPLQAGTQGRPARCFGGGICRPGRRKGGCAASK